MVAVIFGANGQDGFFLEDLCIKNNIKVIGVSPILDRWVKGDVADYEFVYNIVKDIKPDYIFHLAANSTTDHSALFENHKAISTGSLNILESVRLHCKNCKVFLSGSAMQFKNTGSPIDENSPFEASSPYSVARIQSVYAGRYYRQAFGIQVYVGYFFNHDSHLRTVRHVNMKVIQAVKQIARGDNSKILIGDIDVRKEFNFAGDIVKAVWMLINQNAFYEAVIGSGQAYSIKEWLEYCFKRINRNWKDYVEIRKDYVPDYKILVSNPALIKSTGWTPETSFTQLADLMIGEI